MSYSINCYSVREIPFMRCLQVQNYTLITLGWNLLVKSHKAFLYNGVLYDSAGKE